MLLVEGIQIQNGFREYTQKKIAENHELSAFFMNSLHLKCFLIYNELSQKNRFQTAPIATLCLYNIQHETWFLKILSVALLSMVLKYIFLSPNVYKIVAILHTTYTSRVKMNTEV